MVEMTGHTCTLTLPTGTASQGKENLQLLELEENCVWLWIFSLTLASLGLLFLDLVVGNILYVELPTGSNGAVYECRIDLGLGLGLDVLTTSAYDFLRYIWQVF